MSDLWPRRMTIARVPATAAPCAAGSLQSFGGLVAVKAKEKNVNDLFDGLRDRYTYAVSGAKRILLGCRPERRARRPADRVHCGPEGACARLRHRAARSRGCDQEWRGGLQPQFAGAALQSRARVHIGFRSSSEAFIRDNPRGYRRWKGTLQVDGAKVLSVEPYFDNRYAEYARQEAQSPNRISFSTERAAA